MCVKVCFYMGLVCPTQSVNWNEQLKPQTSHLICMAFFISPNARREHIHLNTHLLLVVNQANLLVITLDRLHIWVETGGITPNS